MGLQTCFHKYCNSIKDFCSSCSNCICALCVLASLCCIMGIVLCVVLSYFYHVSFLPTTPSACLEHTDMYDYLNGNHDVKRAVNYDNEEPDDFNYQYYEDSEDGSSFMSRNKRNSTESSSETPSTVGSTVLSSEHMSSSLDTSQPTGIILGSLTSDSTQKRTGSAGTTNQPGTTKSNKFLNLIRHRTTTSTTTVPEVIEYDPDFTLANIIMDSIYTYTERANMKETLGLCRKSTDVQVPEYNASLFPADDASEILNCINDLIHNQTRKQLCVQLDGEMNAYLKWLVLTGEPREKHKTSIIGPQPDSFLFPTSECGKQSPLDQPQCLVDHGFHKHISKKRQKNNDSEL